MNQHPAVFLGDFRLPAVSEFLKALTALLRETSSFCLGLSDRRRRTTAALMGGVAFVVLMIMATQAAALMGGMALGPHLHPIFVGAAADPSARRLFGVQSAACRWHRRGAAASVCR